MAFPFRAMLFCAPSASIHFSKREELPECTKDRIGEACDFVNFQGVKVNGVCQFPIDLLPSPGEEESVSSRSINSPKSHNHSTADQWVF